MLPAGIERAGGPVAFNPSYMRVVGELDARIPATPFVMYGVAETVKAQAAEALAEVAPPYFNRTYAHFSSHRNTPDNPAAPPLGAAVTVHGSVAYIAYPIFAMYQAVGQPLYKYVVRGLLERLLPQPVLTTDLPSAGRATLTRQADRNRHVLHLLYGPPQVRGKRVAEDDGGTVRVMEMIEDVPAIGAVTARVRLPRPPARVYEVATGTEAAWRDCGDGTVEVTVPGLRVHPALVFEETA
jgi:hypothetical protein